MISDDLFITLFVNCVHSGNVISECTSGRVIPEDGVTPNYALLGMYSLLPIYLGKLNEIFGLSSEAFLNAAQCDMVSHHRREIDQRVQAD